MISRKDFTPTVSRRVCSLYFAGGKKIIPIIVPKTVKPIERAPTRTSAHGF